MNGFLAIIMAKNEWLWLNKIGYIIHSAFFLGILGFQAPLAHLGMMPRIIFADRAESNFHTNLEIHKEILLLLHEFQSFNQQIKPISPKFDSADRATALKILCRSCIGCSCSQTEMQTEMGVLYSDVALLNGFVPACCHDCLCCVSLLVICCTSAGNFTELCCDYLRVIECFCTQKLL